uniref:Secreted protein n=1 Tax=Kalanchoe fedtschenkoi TaxID=63787 RepID=A0A7N0U2K5_KALFE
MLQVLCLIKCMFFSVICFSPSKCHLKMNPCRSKSMLFLCFCLCTLLCHLLPLSPDFLNVFHFQNAVRGRETLLLSAAPPQQQLTPEVTSNVLGSFRVWF